MKKSYFKRAGHCTRCEEPFGHNATGYMVRETVVWKVLSNFALTQIETVPVCDACVTPAEAAACNPNFDHTCPGCGLRMRVKFSPSNWGSGRECCSSRCYQRVRRMEMQHHVLEAVICAVCKRAFTPKRADARFCSSGCRQQAYRDRQRKTQRR